MKYTYTISLLLGVTILLTACGTPPPKLAPIMKMPNFPTYEKKTTEFEVNFNSNSNLFHNVVQSKIIKRGSSVVINVPEGISKKNMQNDTIKNTDGQDFKTKNFFNEAEQQIEKELMRRGFNVKSRSKFEAKLRSMRDNSDSINKNYYSRIYNSVPPEYQAILENLKKQFEDGTVTAKDYADQLKDFQTPITKRRSGETEELTDISEVIRAAEAGDVKADYILQINIFETDKNESVMTDLRNSRKAREFISSNPSLLKQFEKGKNRFECKSLAAKLNAKLIHVKTGDIVWIGEHSINEYTKSGTNKLIVGLTSQKYITNKSDIQNYVSKQNTHYNRIARYNKKTKYPTFEFDTKLDGPIILSGYCSQEIYPDNKKRATLARQVAKELISTIKVSE